MKILNTPFLTLLGMLVCYGQPTFAFLGEIKEQRLHSLSHAASNAATPKFRVVESQTDANLVKEFVREDGIVFAVSWKGLQQPDLSELLGSYFPDFSRGLADQRAEARQEKLTRVRGQSIALNGDLIVEHSGHQRNIMGHVFVKSLLPEGVDAHALW